MLDRVATPYVLTLDDDFTLDGASVIEALLHTVAAGHADLAAGRNPVDEDRYGFEFSGLLEVNSTTLALVPGHRGRIGTGSSCCRRVDIVPNLFLARTARRGANSKKKMRRRRKWRSSRRQRRRRLAAAVVLLLR